MAQIWEVWSWSGFLEFPAILQKRAVPEFGERVGEHLKLVGLCAEAENIDVENEVRRDRVEDYPSALLHSGEMVSFALQQSK